MVYGFYATAIAKTFFPGDNPFASLMLSLATFGAGFLMRPLGAVFLALADRHGRRQGPDHHPRPDGHGHPADRLRSRLCHAGRGGAVAGAVRPAPAGFSAGVEGRVSVYLSEIATPGRKGFFVSWQSASQQVAVVFAGLLGVLLNQWLSPQDMGEWGWRVPFFIGCLIVPALFVIRRSLEETPEFEARTHRPSLSQVLRSIGRTSA